ncbi:oxidoreductase [Companilactobacillus mishanensis]|uniref:Oxidoreductase n=1 Tax=Companilactobacillus mishanensis TaxID=2486008 RepID=A0ABW9P8A8_9LACO|nr:oxidoreductase [Companilactobacillus mishanensis]MQS45339.1 oxidoreductase [Companilactobacillus mishanensis]
MSLRIAFIGFGKSANRYHLPYLNIRPDFELAKVYTRKSVDDKLAQPYKDKGTKFTTNLNDVLDDPEIDLVTICTPASTHYELAKSVILANKSVIVEKPFVDSVEHARELLKLGRENGVLVMPYQNRRFDGDYLAVKKVIEQGFLGDILEVESHIDYYRPNTVTDSGTKEQGTFYGLGIHLMDRMVSIFGRPDTVAYDIRNNEVADAVDNYFDVDLHYGTKNKVKVKAEFVVASDYPRFIVHGTNGSFIKYGADQQENDLKAGIMPGSEGFGEDSPMYYGVANYRNSNGDWIKKQIKTPVGDYGKFYDATYDTLINDAPKLVTDKEAITDIELLEAGFKAESPSVYQMPDFEI